uniref:Death domain-containing protein n=1 Tax=Amphimedon queenslandica TaxID=400682 RepID=A0A1X7UWX2_AMPQE
MPGLQTHYHDTFFCRNCWISAAKMCNKLRKEEDHHLTFSDLSQVVQDVAEKNMISMLRKKLNVDIHKTTKSYQEDRQLMEALMKWETKQGSPRHSLIKILHEMQLNHTADKLKLHVPITSP